MQASSPVNNSSQHELIDRRHSCHPTAGEFGVVIGIHVKEGSSRGERLVANKLTLGTIILAILGRLANL